MSLEKTFSITWYSREVGSGFGSSKLVVPA